MDQELATLMRAQMDQARQQLEQNARLMQTMRDELLDQRRINNELITVLGDLRDELEHLRTHRERAERFQRLADSTRPRARVRKRAA